MSDALTPRIDSLCEKRGEPLSGLIWAEDARLIERELAAERAKLNIAREALKAIRNKTSIAGYDSGDSDVCSIAETTLAKIT